MQVEWFKMRTAFWHVVKNMSDEEAGIFLKCIYKYVVDDLEEYGNGREMFTCMQAIGMLKDDFKAFTADKIEETDEEKKARISEIRSKAGKRGYEAKQAKISKSKQNQANQANLSKIDSEDTNQANQANLPYIRKEKNREEKDKDKDIYEEEEVMNAREAVVDSDWKMVADAYQSQVGMLPMGHALDILISYVEDLHGETVVKAIEITNQKTPDNPYQFLIAILKNFEKNGIDSKQKAEAYLMDRERRVANERSRGKKFGREPIETVRDDGKDGFDKYLESTHF